MDRGSLTCSSPLVKASGGVWGAEPRLDAAEDEGVSVGVASGIGTASFPDADVRFAFFCFLDTHGVPWSSCT